MWPPDESCEPGSAALAWIFARAIDRDLSGKAGSTAPAPIFTPGTDLLITPGRPDSLVHADPVARHEPTGGDHVVASSNTLSASLDRDLGRQRHLCATGLRSTCHLVQSSRKHEFRPKVLDLSHARYRLDRLRAEPAQGRRLYEDAAAGPSGERTTPRRRPRCKP